MTSSHPLVVVQKYGGSSVTDISRLRAVAERVARTHREGHAVVVVVSAMGNTTNELLALARAVTPNPGRRELDMLISVGERITMALLSMAINDMGIPAVSFTGSQSGILTDDCHSGARILEVRPERVREALDQGKVAIVAGFQGMSLSREITTLGRGGSDTTAVALAAALHADLCEILTDVDGVFSADPRKVPSAHRIDALSYEEALALFRGGAKVLHPDAVAFAVNAGIRLHTGLAEGSAGGTQILPRRPSTARILAVTVDAELECVRPGPEGLVALLGWLRQVEAPLRFVRAGYVLVDRRDFHEMNAISWPAGVSRESVALATAVGVGAGSCAAMVRAESALGDAGVPVLAREMDADRMSWLLPPATADRAQRVLHEVLVAGSEP
jgi:aspartate kinase